MGLRLYNTATRSVETFTPLHPPLVTMYNCGPTVYNYAHIGNLRPYVFADVLRCTLERGGYEVKQVVNITDVGHLVGDGDEGEDKMTAALKREGRPLTKEAMREVGDLYTEKFLEDLGALHVLPAFGYPKASDHITEDVELVELLGQKGFTYATSDGVYFDTSKFPCYADFAKLDVTGMRAGERIDMGEKKHPTDFALWKFNNTLGYKASFGKGFPGWHIECSAMIKKHLGHPIDIHTGGVDHIPVHHTNEIAQSESAYGAPFVGTWMHCAHMTVNGEKMSKSAGNTYSLRDLHERGIPPLAYRYWLLTAHYRTQVNFTWEALAGAQSAYNRLTNFMLSLGKTKDGVPLEAYMKEFETLINDDMNAAGAIALIWKLTKDADADAADKYATIAKIDEVLGLGLSELHADKKHEEIPESVTKLLNERMIAREKKDYAASDRLRDEMKRLGYEVKDNSDGQSIKKS